MGERKLPNHITNEIRVVGGTNKQRVGFIRGVTNKYGRIDFNNITRMPKSLLIDESTDVENLASAMLGKPAGRFFFGDIEKPKDVIRKLRERGATPSHIKKTEAHALLRIKNMQKYGYWSWYDWACDKWGTKWNAYSIVMPVQEVKKRITRGYRYRDTHARAYGKRVFKKKLVRHAASGADLVIRFQTAWGSPEPIFEEMAKRFPHLEFHIRYADEDTGSNCGQYHIKGDRINFSDIAPKWSRQTDEEKRKWTEFAFKLRNPDCDPRDYGYDENWNYIEE